MNQHLKYLLFALAFVVVGLWIGLRLSGRSGIGSASSTFEDGTRNIDQIKKLQEVVDFVSRNYVEDVDQPELVDKAIKGIMDELDPHSYYIPASENKLIEEQMGGSFEGIGIEFDIVDDTIYVEAPVPNSPSDKLGIKSGDKIILVDGKNVAGINITNKMVMDYLKGPKGTQVQVSILRKGIDELLEFEITRERIPLNSVSFSYLIDDETGYIKVDRFSETTYKEFKVHMETLISEGMQNLILDLRGNPGGYMTMAYRMADEFLEKGKLIVSTEGRIKESKQSYEATDRLSAFEKGPLIILIDYGSASASEIVAGAVQDHDRGLIVGVRSFGKGLVQIQEDLADGSAIRLVISEYHTPSGRCIQKPYGESTSDYEHEILERFQSGEVFDASKVTFPDSLKYKTESGRTVYGGGGIFPDVFVPNDTSYESKYLAKLRSKDIFRDFAAHYVDDHPTLIKMYPDHHTFKQDFDVSLNIESDFIEYAVDHGIPRDDEGFEASAKLIRNYIKAFVGRRLYNDEGFFPVIHEMDRVLQEAISLVPAAKELEKSGSLEFIAKE